MVRYKNIMYDSVENCLAPHVVTDPSLTQIITLLPYAFCSLFLVTLSIISNNVFYSKEHHGTYQLKIEPLSLQLFYQRDTHFNLHVGHNFCIEHYIANKVLGMTSRKRDLIHAFLLNYNYC